MKKLAKKATAVLIVAWIFGNIPAWLFMPRHTTGDGVYYTAIYYTMAPLALPFLIAAGCILFLVGIVLWEWAFVEEKPRKPKQTKTRESVESFKEMYVKDEIDVDQLANLVQKKMIEEGVRR